MALFANYNTIVCVSITCKESNATLSYNLQKSKCIGESGIYSLILQPEGKRRFVAGLFDRTNHMIGCRSLMDSQLTVIQAMSVPRECYETIVPSIVT